METSGPASPLSFHGLILAGGLSTRMGRDKALLEHGGRPMWLRQYELLAEAGVERRIISVRPEQSWLPTGISRVHDTQPGLGPLAGLAAALSMASDSTHIVVLAVDLPKLPVVWLRRLKELCRPGLGVVGRRKEGWFEPLAAIYPTTMRPLIEQSLQNGPRSLQKLIQTATNSGNLQVVPISPEEHVWFENWNEPAGVS